MKSSFIRELKFQIKVNQSQIVSLQYVIKVKADRKVGVMTTAVLVCVGWAYVHMKTAAMHR